MLVKVKLLRQRGARLSDREVNTAPIIEGELVVFAVSSGKAAEIKPPNSQVGEALAILHEARVTTMHGHAMLFKGEERPQGDKGPAHVQEWSVRIGD